MSHHQLRNFISTVYENKIFYVNKYDIYILDLQSKQRSILVTVPFEARCLAAAHGWVCVGGETKGDSAFIHIGENEHGQPGNFCHELLVVELGKEIVNSMNIQLLKHEEEGKREVVVLISNNDRTVTIYSLTQRTVLTTIEHPQPMNYASLSLDATILAAVGDENKVYFLKRSLVEGSGASEHLAEYPEYDWRPMCAPDIPRGIAQPDDFSFAVTFSPNGQLCAVSSQGGAITVFDMDLIEREVEPAEDAIICSFRSSRASLLGCVRSMAFSPAPWDILAWAEDHGRIGLADVRQGFRRRQHIELNKDDMEKLDIKDATPAEFRDLDVKERLRRQHQQRMQALRGHPPVGARSLTEDRWQRMSVDHAVPDQASSLSARERSILQALETTIDGIDTPRGPFSINYTAEHPTLQNSASSARREWEIQLLNPANRLLASHQPRRRSSVVLSDNQSSHLLTVDDNPRMTMTASPGPMSDDGSVPIMSTNDLTPPAGSSSSQPLPFNIPASDPWHVIEVSLVGNRASANTGSRQPAGLTQIESAIYAERQLANRLERQLADERRLSTLLRSELEARERLLEARQQEFQSEQAINSGRMSPSLERLLQRQLHSEHDHGQQRSEELENEIRNMSRRVSQLMGERDSLLQRYRFHLEQAQSPSASVIGSGSNTGNSTSARTSALPTTLTRIDFTELERRMQSMDEERRIRRQRLQDLEYQVRRAESRVNLASLQSNVERPSSSSSSSQLRNRPTVQANDRDDPPTSFRTLPTPPSSSTTANPTAPSSSDIAFESLLARVSNRAHRLTPRVREATVVPSTPSASERTTIPRFSELANRVTDNDLRIARLMMARANADMNGNWTPAAARMFLTGRIGRPSGEGAAGFEELVRESGVGTAGVGWSPDGTRL